MEEGDFSGAVRLTCSDDVLAEPSEATYSALQQKHPYPYPGSSIPPRPAQPSTISVSEDEIIKSFHNGSAGGPDRLRPQHLKDLIGPGAGSGRVALLPAFVSFVELVLSGNTPVSICPFFLGANLFALQKQDGGVRPIAVGCTLWRLVAKAATSMVVGKMAALLAPCQSGYGTKNGAETVVHAMRVYLSSLDPDNVVLKLNFWNVFNSLHRDRMLEAVFSLAPILSHFVHSAYIILTFHPVLWGQDYPVC